MMQLLILLFVGLAHADPYGDALSLAREGRHGEAEAALCAVLEDGGRHAAVYHALGNILHRQGEVGPAMAAWRRAQVLAPRNGDLAANLAVGRAGSVDRLEPSARRHGPFVWQAWLRPQESGLGASFALFLGFLLLARRRQSPGAAGGLVALGLLLALSTWVDAAGEDGAVVSLDQVVGRSALGAEGVELFRLHPGAEVRVVERLGPDALVLLPDGRKGWMPANALITTEPGAPFPECGQSD